MNTPATQEEYLEYPFDWRLKAAVEEYFKLLIEKYGPGENRDEGLMHDMADRHGVDFDHINDEVDACNEQQAEDMAYDHWGHYE